MYGAPKVIPRRARPARSLMSRSEIRPIRWPAQSSTAHVRRIPPPSKKAPQLSPPTPTWRGRFHKGSNGSLYGGHSSNSSSSWSCHCRMRSLALWSTIGPPAIQAAVERVDSPGDHVTDFLAAAPGLRDQIGRITEALLMERKLIFVVKNHLVGGR